jgi:protein TonB
MEKRIIKSLRRGVSALGLFRMCVLVSLILHLSTYTAYRIAARPSEVRSEGLNLDKVEVDFEYIPPELIGGGGSPAPVEKREWIEGTSRKGPDAADEDFDFNAVSGDGTDRDGYLFSFNGDRPPVPCIDFDLARYFPRAAKDANITSGTVILQVQVDEFGRLNGARVVSQRAGYGFDEAALTVIKLARFSPGLQKGRPVKMTHKIPVRFVLRES